MSEGGYKIRNKKEIHFVSFAVVEWIDVFTRKEYRDIFIESLKHCQEKKELRLHAWCVMSNHVHLIISARMKTFQKLSGISRNIPAGRLLKQYRKTKAKAARIG